MPQARFDDPLRGKALKNRILAVELAEEEVARIFVLADQNESLRATVSLPAQKITVHSPDPVICDFEATPAASNDCRGSDDIVLTLQYEADIARLEAF